MVLTLWRCSHWKLYEIELVSSSLFITSPSPSVALHSLLFLYTIGICVSPLFLSSFLLLISSSLCSPHLLCDLISSHLNSFLLFSSRLVSSSLLFFSAPLILSSPLASLLFSPLAFPLYPICFYVLLVSLPSFFLWQIPDSSGTQCSSMSFSVKRSHTWLRQEALLSITELPYSGWEFRGRFESMCHLACFVCTNVFECVLCAQGCRSVKTCRSSCYNESRSCS